MDRKWKSMAAIGMAVLIGCVLPVGTMMAAESDVSIVQEIGTDSVSGNGIIPSTETTDDLSEETVTPVEIAEPAEAAPMAISMLTEAGVTAYAEEQPADTQVDALAENSATPVIEIKWQGQKYMSDSLGGKIDYKYVNNIDQAFECSVNQGGQAVSFVYYLENVADITAAAKGEEELASIQSWTSGGQTSSERISLPGDGNYVLYVKAEADGQVVYARSGGIVVDTIVPEMTILDGNTYPEGTVFWVVDANLESVTVNEKPVVPETDGSYRIVANGTSCVIKAKDKAGHETTCSITISGKDPAADGNIISESGLYKLTEGTEYKLGGGMWHLDGDSTVYRGERTFYVGTNGDYRFTKR